MEQYDKLIIGAGLYGLYAALVCAKRGERIIVLEVDSGPFKRASCINQARIHMGYHYPRSSSTALNAKKYFSRFLIDYNFCVYKKFDQVYATSLHDSQTNAKQFKQFCDNIRIRCDETNTSKYFKSGMCDGAFLTTEFTYDARVLRDYFVNELDSFSNVKIIYRANISAITQNGSNYVIKYQNKKVSAPFVLNTTYSGVNQIHQIAGFEPFEIKYELCEIVLCRVSESLKDIGITVMDGPFFSIMPFGKTDYHSLTSVTFTPHETSYDNVPTFSCQNNSRDFCSPSRLGNCNDCPVKPQSAWPYMSSLAKKYLKEEYGFKYEKSIFAMKPILKASEIDDARPTVIKILSQRPTFISVLSGKISTVYELDRVLT